jgi:hypothetical protein
LEYNTVVDGVFDFPGDLPPEVSLWSRAFCLATVYR